MEDLELFRLRLMRDGLHYAPDDVDLQRRQALRATGRHAARGSDGRCTVSKMSLKRGLDELLE